MPSPQGQREPAPAMTPLLTVPEVAAVLRVSVRTVKTLTRPGGPLAATRVGRRVLVSREALRDYIAASTSTAPPVLPAEGTTR